MSRGIWHEPCLWWQSPMCQLHTAWPPVLTPAQRSSCASSGRGHRIRVSAESGLRTFLARASSSSLRPASTRALSASEGAEGAAPGYPAGPAPGAGSGFRVQGSDRGTGVQQSACTICTARVDPQRNMEHDLVPIVWPRHSHCMMNRNEYTIFMRFGQDARVQQSPTYFGAELSDRK